MNSNLGFIISVLKQVPANSELTKIAKGRHVMPRTWREVATQIKREWR